MQPSRPATTLSDLPKRPRLGEISKKLEKKVTTNYYKVRFNEKSLKFSQYEISFDPEIPKDSKAVIRQAVESVRAEITKKIGEFVHRGNIVWSFRDENEQSLTFKCNFIAEKSGQKIDVKLNLKRTTSFGLNQIHADSKQSQQVLQVLNSTLKKQLQKIGMVEIGFQGRFYNKTEMDKNPVQDSSLKVWRGYTTTIHRLQDQFYVMVDYSTRVLRKQNLNQLLGRKQFSTREDLKGQIVVTTYGNNRTYKIDEIDTKKDVNYKFKTDDGTEFTIKQYYQKKYGLKIQDRGQPLVKCIVKDKKHDPKGGLQEVEKTVYLVPELLNLTGMTDDDRADKRVMKNLAVYTKLEPQERISKQRQLLSEKQFRTNEIFSIDENEAVFTGFQLRPPKIELAQTTLNPENGSMKVRQRLLNPVHLKDWLLVYTDRDDRDRQEADQFLDALKQASKAFGIKVDEPGFCCCDGRLSTFIEKIENDVQKNGKPLIIVTYLTRNEQKFYSDLKKLLYVKLGITHQNVLRNTFIKAKNNLSVATNVLLQINSKLGYANWRVAREHPKLKGAKTIVGGMAIYHKLINKNQSCAAFVGTVNDQGNQYYSSCKLMEQNKQKFQSLEKMIIKWVQTYCQTNKTVPEYIFLFRDAVGDSQISEIIEHEVSLVKKAAKTISDKMKMPGYDPGIAFVLAGKKINQRMYQEEASQGRGRGEKGFSTYHNPTAGTVLSSAIGRYGFDFILVPQAVTQGTATPTHYNVICLSDNLKDPKNPKYLEEEAYHMLINEHCYNYYNWCGAVRVPAPLQYANKLATLVGEHMKQEPKDSDLSRKLYYE